MVYHGAIKSILSMFSLRGTSQHLVDPPRRISTTRLNSFPSPQPSFPLSLRRRNTMKNRWVRNLLQSSDIAYDVFQDQPLLKSIPLLNATDALLRVDGRGFYKDAAECGRCGAADPKYRCKECGEVLCKSCLLSAHNNLTLHRVEVCP